MAGEQLDESSQRIRPLSPTLDHQFELAADALNSPDTIIDAPLAHQISPNISEPPHPAQHSPSTTCIEPQSARTNLQDSHAETIVPESHQEEERVPSTSSDMENTVNEQQNFTIDPQLKPEMNAELAFSHSTNKMNLAPGDARGFPTIENLQSNKNDEHTFREMSNEIQSEEGSGFSGEEYLQSGASNDQSFLGAASREQLMCNENGLTEETLDERTVSNSHTFVNEVDIQPDEAEDLDDTRNLFSLHDESGAFFGTMNHGIPEMHRISSIKMDSIDVDSTHAANSEDDLANTDELSPIVEGTADELPTHAYGDSLPYALPIGEFSPIARPTTSSEPRSPAGTLENESNEEGAQVGRVDASKMGEVENPLQKCGRHTVITGHLPPSNPFSIGARNLGIKMVSKKMEMEGVSELGRREAFKKDLHEFLVEIGHAGYKIPVIGGGSLDLFSLAKEVLLLGGVENVVRKRAFRIVGQQLELPKSCTSAAFVLKNAYSKLLFYYERKLVHDIYPTNPTRNINIKQMVSVDKQREKREARARTSGANARRRADERKRRLTMPSPMSGVIADTSEDPTAKRARFDMAAVDDAITSALPEGAPNDFEQLQDYFMPLVTQPPPPRYELPEWARIPVQDHNYQAFVDATSALEEKREGEPPYSFDKPQQDLGASFADSRLAPQELLAGGSLHVLM